MVGVMLSHQEHLSKNICVVLSSHVRGGIFKRDHTWILPSKHTRIFINPSLFPIDEIISHYEWAHNGWDPTIAQHVWIHFVQYRAIIWEKWVDIHDALRLASFNSTLLPFQISCANYLIVFKKILDHLFIALKPVMSQCLLCSGPILRVSLKHPHH